MASSTGQASSGMTAIGKSKTAIMIIAMGTFRPKHMACWCWNSVLDGKALDFCLLLSSLTSVLGGIGQAAYASSNIYMDSFARRHNRTSPVPWLSVNWDVWRLHDHTAIDSGFGTTLKELGMSAEEATEMMETILGCEDRQPTRCIDGRSWCKNQPMDQTGIAEYPGTCDRGKSDTIDAFPAARFANEL